MPNWPALQAATFTLTDYKQYKVVLHPIYQTTTQVPGATSVVDDHSS